MFLLGNSSGLNVWEPIDVYTPLAYYSCGCHHRRGSNFHSIGLGPVIRRAISEDGSLIGGSGGLRKIRWAIHGRGKRGGIRVIYYWAASRQHLLMLLIYSKSASDALRPEHLKALRRTVSEEFSLKTSCFISSLQ